MAGAIAGTAILHAPKENEGKLHTVTLTVNNSCNFECPHCYLQYSGPNTTLSIEDAGRVLDSDFSHLVIVGKEPTLSPEIVEYLVKENFKRKTSMISNGLKLDNISQERLNDLTYIDISFDGGPETYSQRRKADFRIIIENIFKAYTAGAKHFNALHTLYAENTKNIKDMMRIEESFPHFETIAFSPYKVPHNHGSVSVSKNSIKEIFEALVNNNAFMDSSKTRLLLTNSDLTSGNPKKMLSNLETYELKDKVFYVGNPLDMGFIRVNYDGRVIAPDDATHPLLYRLKGYSIKDKQFKSLNEIFDKLAKKE